MTRLWIWLRTAYWLRRLGQTSEAQRLHARRVVASLMAEARGLPLKVGQVQALMRAGVGSEGPPEMSANPWPLRQILPALRRQLGADMERLREISEAKAAASFGQVHHALLDGHRPVAVKVQYPDVAKAVRAELRWAGLLPGFGPMRKWGFDVERYKRCLSEVLRRELDYRQEARTQERMRRRLAPLGVKVPRVVEDLGTDKVLVQSWHEGRSLYELGDWRTGQRVLLGRQLLVLFLHSLFVAGELHADPNPGNTLFRLSPEGRPDVSLLDFGCVVKIERGPRLALLALVEAVRRDDLSAAVSLWTALGCDSVGLACLGDDLGALTRLILRPFVDEGLFDVADWHLSESVDELLGDRKWTFRAAAPPEMLWVIRALHGLLVQLQHLEARLPWYPLLASMVPEAVLSDARELLDTAVPAPVADSECDSATVLRVLIRRKGQKDFGVALPAREALDLPSVVPPDVAKQLRSRGVLLERVSQRLTERGLFPQRLLGLDDGERNLEVWLE